MRQFTFCILLATLVLAACSEGSPAPTLTSQPSPPQPSSPVKTGEESQAATSQPATVTAPPGTVPSLPHDQLMLAYERDSSSGKRLVLVDPAGSTSYEFGFPVGAIFATPFLSGLSPDARYFVYFEGGTLNPDYGWLETVQPDFGLRILDLDRREVIFSTPLISPDFPDDLKPVAEMTQDQRWFKKDAYEDPVALMWEVTQGTLLFNIRTVDWAPDGSLLAFASQIPGPTSDMHFFDPASGKAWGVTDELGHVMGLTWAPASLAVALRIALYERPFHPETIYLVSRSGTLLATFDDFNGYFNGWANPTTALLRGQLDFGDPFFDLRTLSTIDGSLTTLWEGSYTYLALSPDLSSLLVSNMEQDVPGLSPGLYLLRRDAGTPRLLSEAIYWNVAYWGSERFVFAASRREGTFGISATGEMLLIDPRGWGLIASPQGNYLAAYGSSSTHTGLRVFNGDGELLAVPAATKITCPRWNAVSSILAYQVEDRLYVWQEESGPARQIGSLLASLLYPDCPLAWVNQRLQ